MPDYLSSFLQSLAQSNQFGLQQQAAARQQQELQLQQQKEKNAQQLGLAGLLQEGAKINPPAGTPPEAPTTGSAFGGVEVGMPGSQQPQTDPGRSVDYGGQSVQIPTPQETMRARGAASAGQVLGKQLPPGADPNVMLQNPSEVLSSRGLWSSIYQPQIDAANNATKEALQQSKLDATANKAPKLVGHTITADDQGNQTAHLIYDDGTMHDEPVAGKGKTNQSGANAPMTANEQATHKQQAINDYRTALTTEGKLNTERLRLGAALSSGQHFIGADGSLKAFNPGQSDAEVQGMQDDMRARYDQIVNQLGSVIAQKNDAITRAGGHPGVSTDQAIANLQASHAHNMNRAFNPGANAAAASPQTQTQPTAQPQQSAQPAPVNGQPGALPTSATGGRPTPSVLRSAPPNSTASASESQNPNSAVGAKTASLADVDAYAAAHSIGRDEASRRFVGKGYKINANSPGR